MAVLEGGGWRGAEQEREGRGEEREEREVR